MLILIAGSLLVVVDFRAASLGRGTVIGTFRTLVRGLASGHGHLAHVFQVENADLLAARQAICRTE